MISDGDVIGQLTVLAAQATPLQSLVRCSCGVEYLAFRANLVSGTTRCRRCAASNARAATREHVRRDRIRLALSYDERQTAAVAVAAMALPIEAPPPPPEVVLFSIGDEVRVRGARGVVVKVGPEGVMVRGPRCPAGWLLAEEVEED